MRSRGGGAETEAVIPGRNQRRKRARGLVVSAAAAAVAGYAQGQVLGQPYASYWHPSTILNWNPATDPNAAFNRSNVPLASRISTIQNVNANVTPGAGVTSLVAFAPTSNNPSQGSAVQKYYATNYWQYMDNMVFWGGSAGEGLILAPNAPVIDAAHRNGVRVLGNVFLPPTAYGGQIGWVNEFLQQRTDGSFPVADKMIQAARHYKFDGWFLNQETAGGNATTATKMQSFIKYVKQQAPELHVQWYDSMDRNGQINWQGALNDNNAMFFDTQNGAGGNVSDSMMLDFRWTGAKLDGTLTKVNQLGRNRFDLYTGVDVEGGGYNANVDWSGLTTAGKLKTSLALYRPEWTNNSAGTVADFYARDNRFWVGPNGDPSNTSTSDAWKGIANYVASKSVVKSAPFVTNFNTGHGSRYAINGQTLATGGWNNLSVQDVLPTYRWMISSAGTKLTPSLDFNDAYYGGTSLLVTGALQAVNDLKLYQAEIPLAGDTNFRLVFKPNVANPLMKLAVSFTDNPNVFTYIDVGAGKTAGQWNTVVLPLGAHAGKTLANISLRFGDGTTSVPAYSMRVGQFAIYNGAPSTPAAPASPSVDNQLDVAKFGASSNSLPLRVHWAHSTDTPYYYNLYRRRPDGTLAFLGATPNDAYFVPNVSRVGSENFVTLEVETVGLDFGTSPKTSMSFYVDWARSAQTLTWRGNGAAPGGSGTWDASGLTWNAGPTAPANQFWSNVRRDFATFSGAAGTVTATAPVSAGGLTFASDGFVLAGTSTLTLTSPTVQVTNATDTARINLPITANAGFRKAGNGTLVLNTNVAVNGNAQVDFGTLALAGGSLNVPTGQFWVGQTGTGTFDQSAGSVTVNDWVAVGRMGGTGVYNLNGGTLNKTGSGTNHFILGALAGAGTFNQNGGTVNVNAGHTVLGENAGGSGTCNMNGGVARLGEIQLSYTGAGNGTFNLNGGSVHTPGVRKVGSGLATFSFNGGTLVAGTNSATFMDGLNAANVQSGGAIIDTNGFNITIAQSLVAPTGSTGGLTKLGAGTLTLFGANAYTGPTQVQQGTLLFAGTLPGLSTIVSPLAVLGGSGEVAGDLDVSGTVAPGMNATSPSALSAQNARMRSGSTLAVDIAGGTSFDSLSATGAATIDAGATLAIQLASGFVPQAGQAFDVLSGATLVGNFAAYTGTLIQTNNGPDLTFAPHYLADRLELVATLPGDASLDASVDFTDLVRLAQNYGQDVSAVTPNWWFHGDFTLDGRVDFADLVLLAQHYGQSAVLDEAALPAGFAAEWALAQAAVPEPVAILPMLSAPLLFARRARRRRGK